MVSKIPAVDKNISIHNNEMSAIFSTSSSPSSVRRAIEYSLKIEISNLMNETFQKGHEF